MVSQPGALRRQVSLLGLSGSLEIPKVPQEKIFYVSISPQINMSIYLQLWFGVKMQFLMVCGQWYHLSTRASGIQGDCDHETPHERDQGAIRWTRAEKSRLEKF